MESGLSQDFAKKNMFQTRNFENFFAHLDEAPNVLIVDDDVDAALALEKVFREFGCDTTIASSAAEAQKHMLSRKADLVILDWMLDHDASADGVLTKVNQKLDRFFTQPFREDDKTAIVTHSCLAQNEIKMPESGFYSHFAHWQKPLHRPLLIRNVSSLLATLAG